MSLSLVPEYGSSSSESESENEETKTTIRSQSQSQNQNQNQSRSQSQNVSNPRTSIGSALSSILPPPKASTQGRTVKIVVDLPAPKAAAKALEAEAKPSKQRPTTSSLSSGLKSSGSLFSDLSRILPAPKNTASAKPSRPTSVATEDSGAKNRSSTPTASSVVAKPQTSALIPHSISKKQRTKAAAPAGSIAAKKESSVSVDICGNADTAGGIIDGQRESAAEKEVRIDQPFFTINASDQMNDDNQVTNMALTIDGKSQSSSNNDNGTVSTEPELHYDPTSGYYYDYVSGTYYYYDPESQSYIDASNAQESSHGQDTDVDPSGSDLLHLIGRRGVRRGELEAALCAPVKHVSQSVQLQNSGYSDAKAAAEYSAKQWSENKRKQTQTLIDADNVDKKKKQKHNIMYLALQAQEQEATLKEAFANRKRSKKEAQSKYGF